MGFNKRHINKDRILSVYKNSGAKGVADLYNADAIITPPNSSVCNYVQKIMSSDNTTKQKRHLRGTEIISSSDAKRVRAMMPTQ